MKMLLAVLCCSFVLLQQARADSEIVIRLSYKIVLNPADGTRPPSASESAIFAAVEEMNVMMRSYGRGYRFDIVDPILDVGGPGGFDRPDPSHYYGINMLAPGNDGVREKMESDALDHQGLYAWNPTALNIYVNQANGGGQCAFPNEQLIAIGAGSSDAAWLTLHEIGHFFDLCHTQGCPCGCCSTTGQTGECFTSPGNDEMSDTLPDLACWGQDEIAQHSFGVSYLQLTQTLRERVDDVFLNIMSYHQSSCGQGAPTARLTEEQLDHWSDTALFVRAGVCDGRTLQVSSTSTNSFVNGNSAFPYRTIPSALSASRTGDILLIRNGSYPGPLTISTPETLRTAREELVRIGG